MPDAINTLADFQAACEQHDLTHGYSDDGEIRRRGAADLVRIEKAAERLPREEVERIWNAVVDQKLTPDARRLFYWRWPRAASQDQ